MMKRIIDMLNLANQIYSLPLQKNIVVDGKSYLLAHAMTSSPSVEESNQYYLMGNGGMDWFFLEGIDGHISLCGHTPTWNARWKTDRMYLDGKNSVWVNPKKNVFLLDCGSGFNGGRLACMCLETGERFYSKDELGTVFT